MRPGDKRAIRGSIRRTVKEMTSEFCLNKANEFKKIAKEDDCEESLIFALEYELLGNRLRDIWARDLVNAMKRRTD